MDKKKAFRIVGIINLCAGVIQFVMFGINSNKVIEYENRIRSATVLGNQNDVHYYQSMLDTYNRNKITTQILAITFTTSSGGLLLASFAKDKKEKETSQNSGHTN